MNNRYITYHILIGYSTYNRGFCAHRLWMRASYLGAGAYVPTSSRFRITLRQRRPHEPSSRPPWSPSQGAVKAGGHGGGRSKRIGPPRVEKKAAKRGERSDFPCFNDTILDLLHISIKYPTTTERASQGVSVTYGLPGVLFLLP